MRAMRDRVEKLVASEDTDTANRLKSYLKVCTMAEQLRPDKLHRVPPAELSTLVSAMVAESVKFPVAVCTAIMEHRIATMLKGGVSPKELLAATKPWASSEAEFDLENPTLGSLQIDLSVKLEMYRRAFWRQYFSPMLSGDLRNSKRILQIIDAMHEVYADEDVFEMTSLAAHTLQESRMAGSAIVAILTMAPDPSCLEALTMVQKKQNKSDKSIMTCVSNAIFANELLEERLNRLIHAMPVMQEHHEKFMEFQSEMGGLGADASSFERLKLMCEMVVKVNATPASSLYDDFGKKVCMAIQRIWTTAKEDLTMKIPANPGQLLKSAQVAFAEAALAFSMSDDIAECQTEVAKFLREADAADHANTLKAMVANGEFRVLPTEDFKDAHAKLAMTLRKLAGAQLPAVAQEVVLEEVKVLIGLVSKPAFDASQKEFSTATIDIIECLCELAAPSHMSVVPALRSAIELVSALEAAKPRVDAADAEFLELKLSAMCAVEASAKVCESRVLQIAGCRGDEVQSFIQNCRQSLKTCGEATTKYREELLVDRVQKVRWKVDEVKASLGEAFADQPWHAGITGIHEKAWKMLTVKFADLVSQMDMQVISKGLDALDTAIDAVGSARLSPMPASDDPELKDSLQMARKARGIYFEFQCIWHLLREVDKEELRAKLQSECRAIRKRGYKERAMLHEAIYKKVYDQLAC